MSDLSTARMLEAYKESAGAPGFLSSFFTTGPRDVHNSKFVEVDVRRSGRPIAIAVTDFRNGGRVNTLDLYTNKRFEPPVLYEEIALNSSELLDRQMGADPFQDPNFMAAAQTKLADGVMQMSQKIRRTLELQAAQIFQTGVVSLVDSNGATVYTVDFGMKANHKLNASVDWDETTADPIKDLEAADERMRIDGKKRLTDVAFGDSAWSFFLNNTKVQNLLDNRRIILGGIAPSVASEDQVFYGTLAINGHMVNLWGYQASYDLPTTGADTKYISTNNVICLAKDAPRRATFGGIPRIVQPDPRVAALGIGAVVNREAGLAYSTNAWCDARGENVYGSIATRALLVPVAIDCHAVINAKVT